MGYRNRDDSVVLRVPFSVKKLGAACGVMITGTYGAPRVTIRDL